MCACGRGPSLRPTHGRHDARVAAVAVATLSAEVGSRHRSAGAGARLEALRLRRSTAGSWPRADRADMLEGQPPGGAQVWPKARLQALRVRPCGAVSGTGPPKFSALPARRPGRGLRDGCRRPVGGPPAFHQPPFCRLTGSLQPLASVRCKSTDKSWPERINLSSHERT